MAFGLACGWRDGGGNKVMMTVAAAAWELLHNAPLVHDDLQDGDEVRRGAPTVWWRFGRMWQFIWAIMSSLRHSR
jgi:geranylgeranyl pyrophosphate synthase